MKTSTITRIRKLNYLWAILLFISTQFAEQAVAATLLVVNKSSHTVTLVNESTLTPIKELAVGYTPHEVAVSPGGGTALVSNYGTGGRPGSSLSVINVVGALVERTVPLAPGSRPHGILFLSETLALVTAEGIQSLLLIDLAEGQVAKTIPLPGKGAHLLTTDRNHNYAYIANADSGTVTKLDLVNYVVVAERKIGRAAEGIVLTPDEGQLLVTNRKDNLVAVLESGDLELVKTIRTQLGPIRINLFHDGQSAIFTNSVAGSAQVIDLREMVISSTFRTTRTFSFKTGRAWGGVFGLLSVPITIAVRSDQSTAYIANSFAGNITLVEIASGKILRTFQASAEPDGLALSPLDSGARP